jgi:hypothetical protein
LLCHAFLFGAQIAKDRTRRLSRGGSSTSSHLRPPPELLRASCVEQFLTCGKAACSCHQGQKHGPYYYLTQSLGAGQIRKFLLKSPVQQDQARRGTAAYSQFIEGVEELSQINAELLRRGESLQAQE